MKLNPLLWCALCAVVACGSEVSTTRMGGVFPPNSPACSLEIRNGTMTPEFLGAYETVGVVMVSGPEGEAPNSPRVLALLKPEACGLGGEVVSINSSADYSRGFNTNAAHSYMVFRKKGATGATQKF